MDLEQQQKVLRTFRPRNIAIAMAIGLGFSGYMLYSGVSNGQDIVGSLSNPNWMWAGAIFLTLIARDLGYMYRIKNITDHQLTWTGSFYVIVLWEFASAVTPSVVGGTLVAVFILNREGLNSGKAVAYAMYTAILDNTFFLVASPIVLFMTGWDIVPDNLGAYKDLIIWGFKVSYALICGYTLFMVFGIFIKPKFFKSFVFWFTKTFGFLKRLKRSSIKFGNEIAIASEELKGKNLSYWSKALLSTAFVWSARYFILNCIFATFLAKDVEKYENFSHRETWSKNAVMWVTQLVTPTPGASGAAEGMVNAMYDGTIDSTLVYNNKDSLNRSGKPVKINGKDLATRDLKILEEYGDVVDFADKGFNSAVALFWRWVTYYPYLILGAFLLPKWLRRVFVKTGEDIRAKAKEQEKSGAD